MLNQSAAEAEVETEVFKEQARIISELPIDQLISWFQKGNEGYLLVDSRGAPEFRLSLDNQKALLKKNNLEINRLLAWHSFLNLELIDELIEANDGDIVEGLSHATSLFSKSQLQRMLFLIKDTKTLRAFLRCTQRSTERSAEILQKADEFGGQALVKNIAASLLNTYIDCEPAEFKKIAKSAGYAKNDRGLIVSLCLPEEMQNDILIHGSRQDKLYLADSPAIDEEMMLRLLSFNDPDINSRLCSNGGLPKKVIKGLAKKSTGLSYDDLRDLISFQSGVPESAIVRFLKKAKEYDDAKIQNSLGGRVGHFFMEKVPPNVVNDCLNGVYGQAAKIAAYARSEVSKEMLQHLNANYSSLTLIEKRNLVHNDAIPLDMRSKMSYDKVLWDEMQFNKEGEVDETFNFNFVAHASGYNKREGYPEDPYWARGRILTPISDMMNDLIKEYGEEFLKIYFGKDISVADVRRAYAALNQ